MTLNHNPDKDALAVTPADVAEYEIRAGLPGICAILEKRGLIKIIPEKFGSE